MGESSSCSKDKGKAMTAYAQTVLGPATNAASISIGGSKQTKHNMQHNNQSTILFTPPHIYQFPNEIISLILYQLSEHQETLYQCSLVNKLFHEISNPLLWRDPSRNIFWDNYSFARRFFTCITGTQSPVNQHVRSLFVGCSFWTKITFALLIPHVRHLEEFTVSCSEMGNPIIDKAFQHVPRYCRHLTSLELDGIGCFEKSSFLALGQHCHQLRHLYLFHCYSLPLEMFELLAGCPLETLEIMNRDPEAAILNEKNIADIIKFNRLTSLVIDTMSISAIRSLMKITAASNTTPWPRLAKLELHDCKGMNDAAFIPFIRSFPCLQNLDLSFTRFTDTSLEVMTMCLPSLTHVTLSNNCNITVDGVRRWIQRGRQLVSVRIWRCDHILPYDVPKSYNTHEVPFDYTWISWDPTQMERMREAMMNENNNRNNNG